MNKKIIFICHGNICRSPMAQMIFRHLAASLDVSSAAVSYEEEGNGIYPQAERVLRSHGIPVLPHRAHRITAQQARESNLLVIMDSSNERLLRRIISEEDYPKIHYLMEFAGRGKVDVSDPWYTRKFETAYQDIFEGCSALVESLREGSV